MTKLARDLCLKADLKLFVMLRPRGGSDFTLSELEVDVIKADIEALKSIVDGYVFGVLDR